MSIDVEKSLQRVAGWIYSASHLEGDFLLRSGARSNEYFDKYLFESNPYLMDKIIMLLEPLIPLDTDVIAGLEMGAIPIATILSQVTLMPVVFVRKKAKEHGTCKIVEGFSVEGRKVLVIEDVVTSGGQIVLSVEELRKQGATVDRVLCVIDRQAGAKERLAENNIELVSLFTMGQLQGSISHE